MSVVAVSEIRQLAKARRFRSYVYFLLAEERGAIYVKIGYSKNPFKRLEALRMVSPFDPAYLAFTRLSCTTAARALESDLHEVLSKWRLRGEWFRFSFEDKPEFNRLIRRMLDRHSSDTDKLELKMLPTSAARNLTPNTRKSWLEMALSKTYIGSAEATVPRMY